MPCLAWQPDLRQQIPGTTFIAGRCRKNEGNIRTDATNIRHPAKTTFPPPPSSDLKPIQKCIEFSGNIQQIAGTAAYLVTAGRKAVRCVTDLGNALGDFTGNG